MVTATSEDGLAEVIEGKGTTLLLGVQFHPEMLRKEHQEFNEIFKAFIYNAWKRKKEKVK